MELLPRHHNYRDKIPIEQKVHKNWDMQNCLLDPYNRIIKTFKLNLKLKRENYYLFVCIIDGNDGL